MSEAAGQRPPRITFKDSLDPELLRALTFSLGAHIAVIAVTVAWPELVSSSPPLLPPAYTVTLLSAPENSDILSIGPLAKAGPPTTPKAPPPRTRRIIDPKPAPKVKLRELPTTKPKAKAPSPAKQLKRLQAPVPAVLAKAVAQRPTVKAGTAETRGLEFISYYEQMLDSIRNHWVWVGSPDKDLAVTVRFGITAAGQPRGLRLVEGSGDGRFDRSVLAAVDAAAPLGGPPPAYRKEFSDVEIVFKADEMGQR